MKKFSVVLAAVVLLGFLLAWNPGISQAQVTSYAQDPAQLATESILPVKVSSNTDTILILFRDAADSATATGTTADIRLTFYTSACAKGSSVITNLTKAEVQFGDDAGRFAIGTSVFGSSASLFAATASGVVLGYPDVSSNTLIRWGMSGLVVDSDLGAIYEQQGYPALTASNAWGGFSSRNFEDYYLYGSDFTTTIQLVCPDSTLRTDMNTVAPVRGNLGSTLYEILTIRVYKSDESLLDSLTNKTCSCFTENPGSISTTMANNADVLGFFHIKMNNSDVQDAVGIRVITLGDGTLGGNLYYQGRIRRSEGTGD